MTGRRRRSRGVPVSSKSEFTVLRAEINYLSEPNTEQLARNVADAITGYNQSSPKLGKSRNFEIFPLLDPMGYC